MNFRYRFSIVLIVLGLLSLIMSFGGKKSSSLPAEEILTLLLNEEFVISPDDLAGLVTESDSGIQIIDIREPEEYKKLSIPGAINIPFALILLPDNASLLQDEKTTKILYADADSPAKEAWILAMQKGYRNLQIVNGGMNAWDSIVMNSKFEGEKITAHENAIFERRYKARRLFSQWNAISDSGKAGFFTAKKEKDRQLVGGCE